MANKIILMILCKFERIATLVPCYVGARSEKIKEKRLYVSLL